MSKAENPKVGGCYIWVISFILFIFTFSGAIFLVLYITAPESSTASWYPVIGVSLVCLPWFFWLLTFLYRILSRACGFRMDCFGAAADSDVDNTPAGSGSGGGSECSINVAADDGGGGNGASEVARQVGSPRRVHFGGTVVLGEDDVGANRNKEISRSSSSSSSSTYSRHSDESELPLKLSMAS